MLLNGVLFNSEVWHNLSEIEIRMLEKVDETLLRAFVKAHSKTPLEFLYLEAGVIPIRFIIASRRLIYHQVILKRENQELIKKMYVEQAKNPTKGDFIELIKDDFKMINEVQDDEKIRNTSTNVYKKHIKKCIKDAAFQYLIKKQASHSKIRIIEYKELEKQNYMVSPIFTNEEVKQLFVLRSRTTNCKENFKNKYKEDDLLCSLCQKEKEDQPHLLRCETLRRHLESTELANNYVEYDHIYSQDINKQKEISSLYLKLFKIKNDIEEFCQPAPSTIDMVLMRSDYLPHRIVHSSFGKDK